MAKDILEQMMVTLDSGERLLILGKIREATTPSERERLEAVRMELLMKLGISSHRYGPLDVVGTSVSLVQRDETEKH